MKKFPSYMHLLVKCLFVDLYLKCKGKKLILHSNKILDTDKC